MPRVKVKPLEDYLREQFTSDEERIFLDHYKMYRTTFSNKEACLISLDDVYQDMGFLRKNYGKKLLLKHFSEPEYTIENSIETGEKSSNAPGRPLEIIKMTYNTFVTMCMLADTEKGKKTRKYYLKLENAFMDYTNYELSVYKKQFHLRETKIYELGDTIYIRKYFDVDNLYKVGETLNMNTRDKNYNSHTITSVTVFALRCHDRKLLEQVLFQVLKPYRYKIDVEDYFVIDLDKLKQIVIKMQQMLDNCPYVEYPDVALPLIADNHPKEVFDDEAEHDIGKDDEVDDIDNDIIVNTSQNNGKHNGVSKGTSEIVNEALIPPELSNHVKEALKPPQPSNHDFKKFLEDCFVFGEDYKTNWIDISSRFRLWSRCTQDIKPKLMNYLKENKFKETFIYDPETKVQSTAFRGLQMIPLLPITLPTNYTEIHKFVYEMCVAHVTGRVSCKDLGEAFVAWRNNPSYKKISLKDKKVLNDYLNEHFLASTVHTGERIRYGFYGLTLKGKADTGRKTKNSNRKIVEMLDGENVIRTFESITHASHELNCQMSIISAAIAAKKAYKGFFFRKKIDS